MENPIYAAVSRQQALRDRMDMVADNMANMSTTGFKQSRVLFTEFLKKPNGGGAPLSMVQDYGQKQDFRGGAVQQTGNQLDVALEGDGFFVVGTQGGQRYTRNGHLHLDRTGQLVTADGNTVLGAGGAPISIPVTAKDISIAANGSITTDQGNAGKLDVVTFDDPQQLTQEGRDLFVAPQGAAPKPAASAGVRQAALEGSNVEPVVAMTEMIEVLRQYQTVQNLIKTEYDRQGQAIDKLSKAAG